MCEVSDKRNCIPLSAPGDKHYRTVEYAPDFFKDGATVPLVNFGFLVSIFEHLYSPIKRSRQQTKSNTNEIKQS